MKPPRLPRFLRRLSLGLLGLLALLAMLFLAAAWSLSTEAGTRWWLTHIPGLTAENTRGALLGDFAAEKVTFHNRTEVHIQGLSWQGLNVSLRPSAPGLWGRLSLEELRIHVLRIAPDPQAPPSTPPGRLHSPVSLDLARLQIDQIDIADTPASSTPRTAIDPWRNVLASLHLGEDAGQHHRMILHRAEWGSVRFEGSASLTADAPQLASKLQIHPLNSPTEPTGSDSARIPPWVAILSLQGPWTEPQIELVLNVDKKVVDSPATRPTSGAPRLTLKGTLRPWEAWPIGALNLDAQNVDLSWFHPSAPQTSLDAQATVAAQSANHPVDITIAVRNTTPGRWSDGRLPLRQFKGRAQLPSPATPSSLTLHSFESDWGTPDTYAGRASGSGSLNAEGGSIHTDWRGLRPSILDERAPPIELNGPLLIGRQGASWSLRAQLKGTSTEPIVSGGPARLPVEIDTELGAQIATSSSQADTLSVRRLTTRIGEARLTAEGQWSRPRNSTKWRSRGRLEGAEFNPALWWPGPPQSLWRAGRHRLNGSIQWDLVPNNGRPPLPLHPLAQTPWLSWMQTFNGSISATLKESQIAGVPLSGDLDLSFAANTPPRASLNTQIQRNTLKAEATSSPTAQIKLQLEAHDLSAFQTLTHLLTPDPQPTPSWQGQLFGEAVLRGPPDALSSQGVVRGTDLQAPGVKAKSANLTWHVGTQDHAPFELDLAIAQASWQGREVDTLQLRTTGQIHQHSIRLEANTPVRLPPPLSRWLGVVHPPSSGLNDTKLKTQLTWEAQGGFADLSHWTGQIDTLTLTAGSATWLRLLQAVPAKAQWPNVFPPFTDKRTSQAGPTAFEIDLASGRSEWLGTALEWDPVHWSSANAAGQAELQAHLRLLSWSPAPLLAKLQPDLGWQGDLELDLNLSVQTSPDLHMEATLTQKRGDLKISEDGVPQPLGLQTLRLNLAFHDGQWTFTQAVAGQLLGTLSGALVVSPAPGSVLPDTDSPLQGVIELQIHQLTAWGPWLPAGWRLSGQVHLRAGLQGQWGDPQLRGTLKGQQIDLRHPLEGIELTDGTLQMELDGSSATLKQFTAKSGPGNLRLEGRADLGATPVADLKLTLDHFQLLHRVDRRLIASGIADIRLSKDPPSVRGKFTINEGLIDFSRADAPSLSDDVQVLRPGVPTANARNDRRPASGNGKPMALLVQLNLGDALRVKGKGLETRLQGDVAITAPASKLLINGSVNTTEGSYKAYGQKLTIDRGIASFVGDVANPRLDIEATRPNTEIRVGVSITGTAQRPRVRLFSEPELSDTDKLSWLVLGRGTEGMSGTDISLLQSAALGLLSGEGESPSDRLLRSLGLDSLSLRKSDEAGVSDTIVSMGRQLSKRWYVGYERGLNATEGSWQLIYRAAQRFTLRAQTGAENSLDVIWSWRWQ